MTLIKVNTRGTDNVSGRKNIVINGAMQVAQRATTSTGQGYQTVDRFKTNFAGPAVTTTQHTLSTSDTPYSLGFRKSIQFHVTDPQTPDAAADYGEIETRIEAQDIATSGWNYTSASSKITLSFWVLSTVAGTYSVYLRSLDTSSNGSYSFDYTVSANTWKKVEHTVPGHANLVFNTDNGPGFVMYFTIYYGTNYTGTKTDEAWLNHVSTNMVGDYAQNFLATDEAKFEITGVQLEVGDSASDFEHRSFGEELQLCERYCQFITGTDTYTRYCMGIAWESSTCDGAMVMRTVMRANPTITLSGNFDALGSPQVTGTTASAVHINTDNFSLRQTKSSAFTANNAYLMRGYNNATSFKMEAEL